MIFHVTLDKQVFEVNAEKMDLTQVETLIFITGKDIVAIFRQWDTAIRVATPPQQPIKKQKIV